MSRIEPLIDYTLLEIKPKLVAFDLDGTIWCPDMYQLSGGAPFKVVGDGRKKLCDRSNEHVELIESSGHILHDLKRHPEWDGVKVAWVSRCDEPKWALECLQKFKSINHEPLCQLADSSQIYSRDKKNHFRQLKAEFPEIQYNEMIFFDNEMYNITSVRELGVHCIYCPEGMTKDVWERSLASFVTHSAVR